MGYGRRLRADATVVQIDMDSRTVGKNRDISLGLVGDVGAILGAVTQAVSGRVNHGTNERKPWMEEVRAEEDRLQGDRMARLKSDAQPIHPLRLCYEINEFLREDSVYIGDGGDIVTFSGGVVQPKSPGHWMDPGPLGTLGVGVPFAMACKLAQPHKEVVCLFGDGAFTLTGWDFETMVRFNLPFVGIVGNNSAWNQIRFGQLSKYGEKRGDVANKLSATRYDLIVEAMGGYGELVTQPQDIRPAMGRARASGRPSCVNVILDPDIYSSGTMNQTMYK